MENERCEGVGVRKINECQQLPIVPEQVKSSRMCASEGPPRYIESRSCVVCNAVTCDECRLHCVYNSFLRVPSHTDRLPEYLGYVLHSTKAVVTTSEFSFPMNGRSVRPQPQDDEGILEMKLGDTLHLKTNPVHVCDILDWDLGNSPLLRLQLPNSEVQIYPSNELLASFCDLAERRLAYICGDLSRHNIRGNCECTFRKRCLDRWVCWDCSLQEASRAGDGQKSRINCLLCGKVRQPNSRRIMCRWCKGIVYASGRLSEANGRRLERSGTKQTNQDRPADRANSTTTSTPQNYKAKFRNDGQDFLKKKSWR